MQTNPMTKTEAKGTIVRVRGALRDAEHALGQGNGDDFDEALIRASESLYRLASQIADDAPGINGLVFEEAESVDHEGPEGD